MATVPVRFTYSTGVVGDVFPGVRARLHGSWDRDGRYSDQWSITDMSREAPGDDSVSFRASVDLDAAEQGRWFRWGVSFVAPDGRETWAIPTEVKDRASRERYRSFQFSGQPQDEEYYLAHCTRLGANRVRHPDGSSRIRFAVWAPNAQAVDVVMGKTWDRKDPDQNPANGSLPVPDIAGGYIADDGTGSHPNLGPFPMQRSRDGVWETDLDDPRLRDFAALDHQPYMYRITRNDGSVAYRTDLYSRCQIGRGSFDPGGTRYTGLLAELDGTVSCSVVVDPEKVTKYFREEPPYLTEPAGVAPVWPERDFVPGRGILGDEFGDRMPPLALKISSSTSCTPALWVRHRKAGDPGGRNCLAGLPCCARRERGRTAAAVGVRRPRRELGLLDLTLLRHRVQRRRPRSVQVLSTGNAQGHRQFRKHRGLPACALARSRPSSAASAVHRRR